MSTRDSGDCAAMRVTSEGERSQAAPVAALPRKRLRLVVCFEFFMIYLPFMGNKTWGRQSCLWTRFLARPGAGWKAGGSDDWRVLNRFGETTNGQPVPLGKPWDRQPNFGKLRRKLVSVPGLRRISGQLCPKRLSTPKPRFLRRVDTRVCPRLSLPFPRPPFGRGDTRVFPRRSPGVPCLGA